MTNFLDYMQGLWGKKQPHVISRAEAWEEYCRRQKLPPSVKPSRAMAQLTFDDFDALQREFSSKSILKCIKCKSDNVTWQSVQTCRADESETIFAECKDCQTKWRFR